MGEHSAATFKIQSHTGTFADGVATATWEVVPGSGSGELAGLEGTGGFSASHAEEYTATLEYSLQ